MARDLDADLKMLETVLTLAQNRDIDRAAAIAAEALAAGFEHPLLLNVVATLREHEGRLEESVRLLERAVELAPDDVPARNALALCLQRVDRPADALHHVDELLLRQPQLSFAHANRGNALIALGSLGLARESHLKALDLDPNNIVAMAALASIATHRGEHAEARLWAERTLARVPGYPDAMLSLAAAELSGRGYAEAEALLQGVIADPRAGAYDKARARGLLGDALDALGRYDEAFAAYSACNEALITLNRRHAAGSSVLDYGRALNAAFSVIAPRWAVRPSVGAAPVREHVFLVGFPRSGTTLLEVVLDGHPDIISLEEHELLTDGVLRYMREPLDLRSLADADEATLATLRAAYWAAVAATGARVEGKVFIDKHPLNTLKLPLIARLFPDAKILFACRDPRDVILSCFRRRFKMNPAMYQMLTLDGAGRFYDAVMTFAQSVRPVLGLAWRQVRYEEVMADFSGEMRGICGFLGVEWTDGMGSFAERVQSREHATPSTAQLTRGLDRSGVGHWRHYARQLVPLKPVLDPWVERLAGPTTH
ncbi:MAG: sulfotransferase [Proteobacteria bacterium]|nr:sulfotransferase [Pseudomonadota bacterium]